MNLLDLLKLSNRCDGCDSQSMGALIEGSIGRVHRYCHDCLTRMNLTTAEQHDAVCLLHRSNEEVLRAAVLEPDVYGLTAERKPLIRNLKLDNGDPDYIEVQA